MNKNDRDMQYIKQKSLIKMTKAHNKFTKTLTKIKMINKI